MAIEPKGPGGVGSSYGTRTTIPAPQIDSANELRPNYTEFSQGEGFPVVAQTNPLTGVVEILDPETGLPISLGGGDVATESGWVNFVTGTASPRDMLTAAGDTTATSMMSKEAHISRAAVTSLKIVVPNYYFNGASGDSAPGDATATCTASIEYPAGTYTQVRFGGDITGPLPNGGLLTSDDVAVTIPNATTFWVRIYRAGFTAGKVPFINGGNSTMGDIANYGTSVTDMTMGGVIGSSGSPKFRCAAIISKVAGVKSYLLLGDSRVMGTGETYSPTNMDFGILARGIGPYAAYCNIGTGSDRSDWFVSNSVMRRQLAQYCTHAVGAYGVNDLGAGRTPAAIVASIQAMRGLFPSLPFYQSTIHAATNAGNTAALSYEANRVALNDLIRSGISGLYGWVEGADPVESARDSGLFASSTYTTDGLHMSQAGYLALAKSGKILPQLMP